MELFSRKVPLGASNVRSYRNLHRTVSWYLSRSLSKETSLFPIPTDELSSLKLILLPRLLSRCLVTRRSEVYPFDLDFETLRVSLRYLGDK